MIPFLVTERYWQVIEWGGVKFPMCNRPKKAQSLVAQNWRSASLSNRSMSHIWDRCLGINGALGLTVTALPHFIPRSNELNCQLPLMGLSYPNSWWIIRMILRYCVTDVQHLDLARNAAWRNRVDVGAGQGVRLNSTQKRRNARRWEE